MTRHSHRLLIEEPPLQVLPSLAAAIGLNEAIILQQIHYWIRNPKIGREYAGRRYVRNSLNEWEAAFPFWSRRTIQRIFSKLEEMGLIAIENLDKGSWDRTKWYTVNYEVIDCYLHPDDAPESESEPEPEPPCGQNDHMHVDKVTTSKVTDCPHRSGQNGQLDVVKVANSLISNNKDSLSKTQAEREGAPRARDPSSDSGEGDRDKRQRRTETQLAVNGLRPTNDYERALLGEPATEVWLATTEYWPGWMNLETIIGALGEHPNHDALDWAWRMWVGHGYRRTNVVGVLDWYKRRVQDPNWTPLQRYAPKANGKTSGQEDTLARIKARMEM